MTEDHRRVMNKTPRPYRIQFASYAESDEQLQHVCWLCESLREFAGSLSDAPVVVYIPESYTIRNRLFLNKLADLHVETADISVPAEFEWYYYSGKVAAAGMAELNAEVKAESLVWMDEDTVVLREPSDLTLDDKTAVAYRPVTHNRSGCLFDEEPGLFWERVYDLLAIDNSALFPMVTPADNQKIRAYFNAGLLSVRPELRLFRDWCESFARLAEDPLLHKMCMENVIWRIFLHQAALIGPILRNLKREEMAELSDHYNYPLFFKRMYGADREFDDLRGVATMRYDVYFKDPEPDWAARLKGPEKIIDWLKSRLG
jgi:hypothetical protein